MTEVTVWFAKDMVRYMGDSKYHHDRARGVEVKEGFVMTFLTSYPEMIQQLNI